jgi:sulfate adenylyltransferase subunit 1 (EFTu-like GTPase family)
LGGDNVVTRSAKMPWYRGPPLLELLETVDVASDRNLEQVRFPVQWVIRPQSKRHGDYRAYAGQLLGGVLHPGDELLAVPSGRRSRIRALQLAGQEIAEAFPPMSISVSLEDDIDLGRGDMLCGAADPPTVGQDIEATLCWMSERPLEANARLAIKHTTRSARAVVQQIRHRLDVNSLQADPSCRSLQLNDIGQVTLRTTAPLFFDPYPQNRLTGCFILMDEGSNATVAGGMIRGVAGAVRP